MDNISLSHRIVGAIVILSLGIIFIPLFLETDKVDPGKINVSPIPEIPREISTIIFQLNEETGQFEELNESKEFSKEVKSQIATVTNEHGIEPSQSDVNVEIASEKKVSPASTKKSNNSWMLQVASFKDKQKAVELRNQLRKQNFVAHVNERKSGESRIWRVRIGPVLWKEKITQIQAQVNKDFGLNGLIIKRH